MHNLKNMLYEELKKYEDGGELSVGSLDIVHKITDTIKNIDKIEMLEEEGGHSERRGYSRDGDWMARGSYDDDLSSRRNRDSMGRYSRESYDERRSYADGKEHMIERIEEMMREARNPHEREALRKCLEDFRGA
jgi:hypothetical protein